MIVSENKLKKTALILLILSAMGWLTCWFCFLSDVSFFIIASLFVCSTLGFTLFSSLLFTEKKKEFLILLGGGMGVFLFFLYAFFLNAPLLLLTGRYLLTVIIFSILLSLCYALKPLQHNLASITRLLFGAGGLFLIILLLSKQTSPLLYDIDFFVLMLGSFGLLVSLFYSRKRNK
jgi:hypothetical protein